VTNSERAMKKSTIHAVIPDRIVFDVEGEEITGIPPSTARAMEARSEYPRARRVGGRRKGRLLSELVEWVRSRPFVPLPEPRQKSGNEDNDESASRSADPVPSPIHAGEREHPNR
jgi:predicted DNA-binding transcriptional regulator AlpA